jgi:tetratricopeptide (TPR) repeat protein
MNTTIKLTSLIFIVSILFGINNFLISQKSDNSSIDTNKLDKNKIEKIERRLNEVERNEYSKLEKLTEVNIIQTNRIIDWTSMFLALIAVFSIIAGAIGFREFSKYRQLRKEVEDNLLQIKEELKEIDNYKESLEKFENYESKIRNETEDFIERIFYFNSGLQHYYEGNYTKAKELLYKAIDRNPKDTHALYYLAKSFYREGNQQYAEEIFNKIINIDPNNSYGYLGLAEIISDSDKRLNLYLKSI